MLPTANCDKQGSLSSFLLVADILKIKMPFKYIRKRDNFGKTEPVNMREAVKCVLEGERERKVAQRLKIPRSTLQRYVAKGRCSKDVAKLR